MGMLLAYHREKPESEQVLEVKFVEPVKPSVELEVEVEPVSTVEEVKKKPGRPARKEE